MQTKNFSASDYIVLTPLSMYQEGHKSEERFLFSLNTNAVLLFLPCQHYHLHMRTSTSRSPLHLTFLLQSEFLRQTPINFPSSFLNPHSFSGIHPSTQMKDFLFVIEFAISIASAARHGLLPFPSSQGYGFSSGHVWM